MARSSPAASAVTSDGASWRGLGGRLAAKNVGTIQGDTQDGLTLRDGFRVTLLDVASVLGIGRSGLSAGTLCDLTLQRVASLQGKVASAFECDSSRVTVLNCGDFVGISVGLKNYGSGGRVTIRGINKLWGTQGGALLLEGCEFEMTEFNSVAGAVALRITLTCEAKADYPSSVSRSS